MKEYIQKFTSRGQKGVDCCASTFATSKSRLLLPMHCSSFLGWRLTLSCLKNLDWRLQRCSRDCCSMQSMILIARLIFKMQHKLWYLPLIELLLDGNINCGIPAAGCVLHSLFLDPSNFSSQLLQRALVVWNEKDTSPFPMVGKVASADA